jgi:putative ABC transport system substrate-binding protein
MRRRDFISLVGGAVISSPHVVWAQPSTKAVIGYLSARSRDDTAHLITAFKRGLAENGFPEVQNVTIEYRFANGQYDTLPAMAKELVDRQVAVIATTGGEPAALAAKAATSTIPIVFAVGSDPVKLGLAASFSNPGGNTTGITTSTNQLEAKRLGLLRELLPDVDKVGFLLNPNFPQAMNQLSDVQEAARALNVQIAVLRANTDQEIDAAFAAIVQERIRALSIAANPFFDTRRDKLVGLAERYAVPCMYQFREFAEAGGLMSYGLDFSEVYRTVGEYTGQVLKGAKPTDLPIIQATKFEFVINLKTAKSLGIKVTANFLSLADQVIE